jgi:S-DNA-T family DNA segregation ATPase FtsK/SpoIIIE
MARKQPKKNKRSPKKIGVFFQNRQNQFVLSLFLMIIALLLFIAFISFFKSWQADQSILTELSDKNTTAKNWIGKIGAQISNFFLYKGFGVGSFVIPVLLFFTGLYLLLQITLKKMRKPWFFGILGMVWISLLFGFINLENPLFSGTIGFELNKFLSVYIGKMGIISLLFLSLLTYIVIRFKLTPESVFDLFPKKTPKENNTETALEDFDTVNTSKDNAEEITLDVFTPKEEIIAEEPSLIKTDENNNETEKVDIDIEKVVDETHLKENLSDKLLADFGEFDPTLELSNFKFPSLDKLKDYKESISVNPEELQQNKDRIVETLRNYKIGISHIKATVGPTVTLYEIIPQAGVRISKIKNLEDDIALSLSALGIRIIAPIPGKGTIGIEVPNKNPSLVSMRSVISSAKFQNSEMELPIAFGKTISNETFVVDLAKMPHLLMAGATGQGKSVGLNAVLTSLLYKKHPAEVKFVLVDPKKVELTLYNKIERHYLAKLPDSEEAIITDTTKVVNTLNSLCIEMDDRYELLKNAFVRNIKEYNTKFKDRKLNPENGHRFLPYIVLVIDEFADLIMTAGKEIETPIARLAQLARAIGIHLIVATQRPSVNVITGIIKANFPARIAFRVTSKIDSRTILDGPGADQLIGKGDMLFSGRSELIRLQCAFVDTPEIEKITDFIGAQRAYPDAYQLPEYSGEENSGGFDIDIDDRDKLFYDAALVIVRAQQGSASLLQRKLKLGYNRAGRLIDQLEAAGIVGPFEGSKARQVLVPDELSLKQLLDNEKNNL